MQSQALGIALSEEEQEWAQAWGSGGECCGTGQRVCAHFGKWSAGNKADGQV